MTASERETEIVEAEKAAWVAPSVEDLGSISELTHGGITGYWDPISGC